MKKWLKLLSAALLFLPAAASAQWTTDYSKNTQVTPVGLNYDENEVVTNDDGITYAFFIIQSNGTLDMRLQILDKQGNKVMERGGHSVSHEANKVWSPYNQHLALDNKGNVFVGVQDFRTAPEQSLNSYTIYKYSPEGELLWEGTTLNAGKATPHSSDSRCAGLTTAAAPAPMYTATMLRAWTVSPWKGSEPTANRYGTRPC